MGAKKKRKHKGYLFFDKQTADWFHSLFVPVKKFAKSKKFKRGY